jgi:hypothetical protein
MVQVILGSFHKFELQGGRPDKTRLILNEEFRTLNQNRSKIIKGLPSTYVWHILGGMERLRWISSNQDISILLDSKGKEIALSKEKLRYNLGVKRGKKRNNLMKYTSS